MQWEEDLRFFFLESESACGVRSSLGAQIAALERGGAFLPPSSDCTANLAMVAREARIRRVFVSLDSETQRYLHAHYCGIPKFRELPKGVRGQLDDPPWIALMLAADRNQLSELLTLCAHPGRPGASAELLAWRRDADAKALGVHENYRKAKTFQAPLAKAVRRLAQGAG